MALSLVKKTPYRHRAGFEPKRASPFRKWVSPPNTRRSRPDLNDDPSLCATLYTDGGVGELYQRRSLIVTLPRLAPHQDWGRARTAGNRFARNDKELGLQLGEAASGAKEQTARATSTYGRFACLLSPRVGSIN
jgi:hypothetical protein